MVIIIGTAPVISPSNLIHGLFNDLIPSRNDPCKVVEVLITSKGGNEPWGAHGEIKMPLS